jgi:diguanylate cyclase (GGDEF)-like protein
MSVNASLLTRRTRRKKSNKTSVTRSKNSPKQMAPGTGLYIRLMLQFLTLVLVFMYLSFTISIYPLNYIWVILFLMITIIGFIRGLITALISSMFAVFCYGSLILYHLYIVPTISTLELNDVIWLLVFPLGAVTSGVNGQEIHRLLHEYHLYRQMVSEHVTIDAVTGFPNERHFRRDLSMEISRTLRYGHSMTVLLVEVAWFNEMLKDYGKETTDTLLREISDKIQTVLRDEDKKAYLGHGRFALILPETNMERAEVVIERLDEHIRTITIESTKGKKQIEVQIRYGYSGCPEKYTTANELLADADRMLEGYATG